MDWLGLAIALALGLALAWSLAIAVIAWQITHPPKRGETWALAKNAPASPAELRDAAGHGRAFSTWTFKQSNAEGIHEVWDVPGDDPNGPDIVFSHGWGDSRVVSLPRIAPLLPLCRRVIMWDFPAHGDQPFDRRHPPRQLCTLGVAEVDDLADLSRIVSENGIRTVILAGFSLGAGASIAAAAKLRDEAWLGGVIAEAPYRLPQTPAASVMSSRGMPVRRVLIPALHLLRVLRIVPANADWLRPGGSFDRARVASQLTCPLLVLHSADDEVCPLDDAEAISAAAHAGSLTVVHGPSHTRLWDDPASHDFAANAIRAFIANAASWKPAHVHRST